MKARIKLTAWSSNTEMDKWLKANAGKLINIDTSCLFSNQYNTDGPNINECTGYRIFDTDISEVVDDARIGKGKCRYCGEIITVDKVICMKHAECPQYGVEWWTDKNCFFIAHPKGLPAPNKVQRSYEPERIKIGSYYLESSPESGYYRLSNCRKRIDFQYDGDRFWVKSLGYIGKKHLDIPYETERKLKLKLKKLVGAQ